MWTNFYRHVDGVGTNTFWDIAPTKFSLWVDRPMGGDGTKLRQLYARVKIYAVVTAAHVFIGATRGNRR